VHTLASFLVSFPEFSATDAPLLTAKLAEAEAQIDPLVWGSRSTAGHGYLTAHLLAMSPFGNAAKLVDKKSTTYETHYLRLVRIVTAGIRHT
jgi:hypothetical protein